MKRLLWVVLFCIVMTTSAFAADPVVTLNKAVYTDDNTLVNLSAIVPYREIEFQYDIVVDTPAITYRYYVQTGNQNTSGNGSLVGSISPFTVKAEFASMEVGKISLFVYDSNSGIGMSETQLQSIAGIPPVVHVTGIKLRDAGNPLGEPANHIEMTLPNTWSNERLESVIEPANATNKKVMWSSSNKKVVTVDSDGWVQGLISGNATITATTEDGDFKATCKVTVLKNGAPRIAFDSSFLELNVGEYKTISMGCQDENGRHSIHSLIVLMITEDLNCKYSIDDPMIATFSKDDNTGLYLNIQGLQSGSTILRAQLLRKSDGYPTGDTAECQIRVVNTHTTPTPTPPDDNGKTPAPQQPEPKKESGGGGGCNAGLVGLLALALVPMVGRKKC